MWKAHVEWKLREREREREPKRVVPEEEPCDRADDLSWKAPPMGMRTGWMRMGEIDWPNQTKERKRKEKEKLSEGEG